MRLTGRIALLATGMLALNSSTTTLAASQVGALQAGTSKLNIFRPDSSQPGTSPSGALQPGTCQPDTPPSGAPAATTALSSPPLETPPGHKPRVVITTDPELDDSNSLVRYLLYAKPTQTIHIIA